MRERGHEVTLLTNANSPIERYARQLGILVATVPMAHKSPRALFSVARWLFQHRRDFDVINTHSSTDSWLLACATALLGGKPPIVRTRHVSTAINNHWTTRWLYQTATRHIVTTGEALRQELHRHNGYPLAHMTSIRTGIDLQRFHPMDKQQCRSQLGLPQRPTLGVVATLRRWKGHEYLLDAWQQLRAEFGDWQLIIVGDGPQREHLRQRLQHPDLAGRVLMPGNRDDVPLWLNCMDLFTLPSFGNEGVPQGIMQAMACALPVVSTPVGAIEEVVSREVNGLLVTPKDADALALALGRLMRDSALRQQMSQNALEQAQAHFGIEHMLRNMEQVFAQAIADG